MAIGIAQVPGPGIVVVVVVEVGVVVVVAMVVVVVVVMVVVVVGAFGGITVRLKLPDDPPQELAYPSTTIM
jgi:hypothetical protein